MIETLNRLRNSGGRARSRISGQYPSRPPAIAKACPRTITLVTFIMFVGLLTSGCSDSNTDDGGGTMPRRDDVPLDLNGQVRVAIDALCDVEGVGKKMEHLDTLRQVARGDPALLLPYLSDLRPTLVTSEQDTFSTLHRPYAVWKEIDLILCEEHLVPEHRSRPEALEYWEGFVKANRK